ncbi:MAG: thioredoxin family protein [Saccharofermentanales bacterium]
MGFFSKRKDEVKAEAKGGCSCGGTCNENISDDSAKPAAAGGSVKILGSGCAKCNELEANTRAALEQLGMDTTIDHVTDFVQIAAYGVMTTPALVVDGKVAVFGKVLKTDEIVKILKKVR